jgi:hypothetical protein
MNNDTEQNVPQRKPAGLVRWWAGLGGLLLIVAIVFVSQRLAVREPSVSAKPPPRARPLEITGDGYVSSEACLECHESEHESWHASYHRSMTQIPSSESVIGHFDGRQAVAEHLRATFEQRGDEFWVSMVPIDGKKLESPVVMTTGSHNQQTYWISTGWERQLAMVPFVYVKEADRWIPRRSIFIKPPGEGVDGLHKGRWNHTCIACHTTRGVPAISDEGMLTQAAEFGIACEACHGPGENHVRYQRGLKANVTEGLPEDDIVNPANLSHDLSSQVCGQCHSTLGDDMAEFTVGGDRYRPGADIWETRNKKMIQRADTQFWSDGIVRVGGREFNGLIDSPCYQHGDLSCQSCHSLHKEEDDPRSLEGWANQLLRADIVDNQACLQCHKEYGEEEKLTAHTHHTADSSGSLCYNCHMPHTSYGLLKAIRCHEIFSPDANDDITTGRTNACNLCHMDKTLAWGADYLKQWYGIRPPKLTEQQRQVSALLLTLLTGDAGQRALAAWHMGWKPAQETSGSDWLPPYLAQLLEDPYDAVRYIAQRSLRSLPEFENFSFDFLAPEEERSARRQRAVELWQGSGPPNLFSNEAVLIDESGNLRDEKINQLLKTRSNRDVYLRE